MSVTPVPLDHIELLTTAAVAWKVIVPQPVAALAAGRGLFAFSSQQTADLLVSQRAIATGAEAPTPYTFKPVSGPLEPVQVLKAVHAYEFMCEQLGNWHSSVVHRILQSLGRAAAERLPGYSEAAWQWQRELQLTGVPIGVGLEWRPAIAGLEWHGVDVDPQLWAKARLVVVTAEAWPALQGVVPQRPGINVLLSPGGDELPHLWSERMAVVSRLLWWPEGRPWLLEQLAGGRP